MEADKIMTLALRAALHQVYNRVLNALFFSGFHFPVFIQTQPLACCSNPEGPFRVASRKAFHRGGGAAASGCHLNIVSYVGKYAFLVSCEELAEDINTTLISVWQI